MTEDELFFAYDSLNSEVIKSEKSIGKNEADLIVLNQHLEKAINGTKTYEETLDNLVHSKIISLDEYKSLKKGLYQFRQLAESNRESYNRLVKIQKNLRIELPKMRNQLKMMGEQLKKFEQKEKHKVLEFKIK